MSFSTPKILGVKVLLFVAYRCYLGDWSFWDTALVLLVGLWWPMQEWFLHRTVLHMKPKTIFGYKFDPMFAKRHRYHHRFPWVLETTFLPSAFVLTLVPLHIAAWVIAAPSLELACTGIAAYSFATLVYEWTHFLTHSAYRPKSNYVKTIYRNHSLHHFKNGNYWFSFTVPAIDWVCGTEPNGIVAKSDTCRTLGVDDSFVSPVQSFTGVKSNV